VSQEPTHHREDASDDASTGGPMTVGDDRLPEDLRPSDDNPLAQPVDDDAPDDLLLQESERAGSGGGSEDASSSGDDDASDTSSSTASSETESGA
jgi:hypothetical protein